MEVGLSQVCPDPRERNNRSSVGTNPRFASFARPSSGCPLLSERTTNAMISPPGKAVRRQASEVKRSGVPLESRPLSCQVSPLSAQRDVCVAIHRFEGFTEHQRGEQLSIIHGNYRREICMNTVHMRFRVAIDETGCKIFQHGREMIP